MIKLTVLGVAETMASLASAAIDARTAAVGELDVIAGELVTEMQAKVPVESGGLRQSIRKHAARDGKGVVIIAGGTSETLKPSAGGFTFDEALGVEYGTTKMPAKPFFFPVVEAHRSELEGRVKSATEDAIKDL